MPTPVDHAEKHRIEMRTRLTKALTTVKADLDRDDAQARAAAWSCKLLLIGAITDSSLTAVQAWTYAQGHLSQCLRDPGRTDPARDVYARVLATLNGK
jgi:hypothetical protein